MTSSSSAAAAAILAAPSSTLSPHAAPFILPARPVCAPPGRHQDGDASRSISDNFVMNEEDKKSHLVSPAAYIGMKSCGAVYPAGTHGIHQSQPSSSSGVHVSVYPSSTSSTSGIISEPSIVMASDLKQQQSEKGSNGSKHTTVTIKSPPNKTSGTNNTSFGSMSKLAIRENGECNNETGTMIFSKELNHVVSVKPLCLPSTCASSCISVADDVNSDPSECSVDSPCWRGASACRVSSFNVLQTSAAQSIKQDIVEFDAGREQNPSTLQHCEAPTEFQNLVTSKSKQSHSQLHVELPPKKPGDIETNMAKDSDGEELELAKHGAEKCIAEQNHCLEVRDNCLKRSGLNTAACDFIPSSVRKSNTSHGSCSSTGRNISGILKAIESLSEVLRNNYSDEIELEEHDHNLLQSIIENLQSYLHKARKGPVMGASDKAGLKAHHSQNAVSKSVAGNCNGSYTADGKSIIISNLADSSHLLDNFGQNSLKGYQPSVNNFPKACEEDHSQVLVYKSLWIDAERVNCELKYQLKQARMEIDLESNMAHIGGGPRNPSFQLCDMDTDPSNSYGSAIACPPMLKGHPGARKSQNLVYAGDFTQSGDNSVVSRSKGNITVPKNIQGEHFLSGLEETGTRRYVHPGLQLAQNRAPRGLNASTLDGMSSLSHITGRDGILCGSCEFGSSDWDRVLKDEIA
ncbi:uncharacterized protein LOC133896077 [Phragmites australis]|uniref:uncharacterized protein LOC133896077 n=1 Tax=Phragmites australis TaxID=29695 RepID=UPI002D79EC31|nr:uncharacterized protein LOC133896077 [Phragmites australis]